MHLKFFELPVHNQDRAISFYIKYMNMTVKQNKDYGGDWRWVELAMDGGQTNILMTKATTSERPSSPTVAFVVESIDTLYTTLSEGGVEIKQPPEKALWNPEEISMLFYDSEDNLVLVSSSSTTRG